MKIAIVGAENYWLTEGYVQYDRVEGLTAFKGLRSVNNVTNCARSSRCVIRLSHIPSSTTDIFNPKQSCGLLVWTFY